MLVYFVSLVFSISSSSVFSPRCRVYSCSCFTLLAFVVIFCVLCVIFAVSLSLILIICVLLPSCVLFLDYPFIYKQWYLPLRLPLRVCSASQCVPSLLWIQFAFCLWIFVFWLWISQNKGLLFLFFLLSLSLHFGPSSAIFMTSVLFCVCLAAYGGVCVTSKQLCWY